jgi:hypothetical protein
MAGDFENSNIVGRIKEQEKELGRVARWPSPQPLCSKVAVENLEGPWKIQGPEGP